MDAGIVTGTGVSGKSVLSSRLIECTEDSGGYLGNLTLDPAAISLPNTPDVNGRHYIGLNDLRETLGPRTNGSVILESNTLAARINEIRSELDLLSSDYVIVDNPGQIQLFASRTSTP